MLLMNTHDNRDKKGLNCLIIPRSPVRFWAPPLIPEHVVQALRQHRGRQEEERQDAGSDYRDYGLVFCTPLGTPLNHDNVANRDFKRVLKVAGLPSSSTLYSLRHSCATLLLSEGVHPKVVSERLGHANITTTLQTYAHVLPTMQEKAIEVLDRLMTQLRSEDDRVGGDEPTSLPADFPSAPKSFAR